MLNGHQSKPCYKMSSKGAHGFTLKIVLTLFYKKLPKKPRKTLCRKDTKLFQEDAYLCRGKTGMGCSRR